MLPLSDGVPARRFPVVTVLLIVANFAVWLLYELPNLNGAIFHASFYPCTIDGACHGPEPWGLSWITAMFLHGGWDHVGGFLFGWIVARALTGTGRIDAQQVPSGSGTEPAV